ELLPGVAGGGGAWCPGREVSFALARAVASRTPAGSPRLVDMATLDMPRPAPGRLFCADPGLRGGRLETLRNRSESAGALQRSSHCAPGGRLADQRLWARDARSHLVILGKSGRIGATRIIGIQLAVVGRARPGQSFNWSSPLVVRAEGAKADIRKSG